MTEAEQLARLFDQPEEAIDLGRAAFVLARAEHPGLDLDAEVARLDGLAAQAVPHVNADGAAARVLALCSFLAGTCGFHGNEQDYFDPKNSFLNQVLDRRTGIPITLSIVYMEVGRRLGIPLRGVGLPGHFVVKYHGPAGEIFLDPFHGGRALTAEGCREMVERMYDGRMEFRNELLAAVDKRYILLRMLNNLRGIYLQRRQPAKAARVLQMALALTPSSAEAEELRNHLKELRKISALLN